MHARSCVEATVLRDRRTQRQSDPLPAMTVPSFALRHPGGVCVVAAVLSISFLAVYHSFERSTFVRWRDTSAARMGRFDVVLARQEEGEGEESFGYDPPRCRSKADREWPRPCNASQPPALQKGICLKRWKADRLKSADSLPEEAVEQVQSFVLFIGHAHSGSSITGSLLDAHLNVVLANEHYTLHQLVYFPRRYSSRWELFASLLARERSKAAHFQESARKGYSLYVNSSGMGHYEGRLQVIGDKAAGSTVGLYLADPLKFQHLLDQLRELVGVPLKFVHVIRNPFDTIASAHIYKVGGAKLRVDLMQQPYPAEADLSSMASSQLASSRKLDCAIHNFFEHEAALEEMRARMDLDILQVHLSDLVQSPSAELGRVCTFLDLDCGRHYLDTCQAALFKELSRTREKVPWSQKQITAVEEQAAQVPSLRRYSFTSK